MVAFDLPVGSKIERKRASDFRKFLIDDGFLMMQFSIYIRPCVSYARQVTHVKRVRERLPEEGSVRIIFITRAQWERSYVMHGNPSKEAAPEEIPEQTLLW